MVEKIDFVRTCDFVFERREKLFTFRSIQKAVRYVASNFMSFSRFSVSGVLKIPDKNKTRHKILLMLIAQKFHRFPSELSEEKGKEKTDSDNLQNIPRTNQLKA